jgi:hypothetical protein
MHDLLKLLAEFTTFLQAEWPWLATSLLLVFWLWFRNATSAAPPIRRSARRAARL